MRQPLPPTKLDGRPRFPGYSPTFGHELRRLPHEAAVARDRDTHVASWGGLPAYRIQLQLLRRKPSRLYSEIFQQGLGLQDTRRGSGHDHSAGRGSGLVEFFSLGFESGVATFRGHGETIGLALQRVSLSPHKLLWRDRLLRRSRRDQ